jgi:16S rRNA (cytidine1402-2'-O)-methyltransferase
MPLKPAPEGSAAKQRGTLYLVATPIGNLADITLRALETLRSVSVIAAEDTRHSRKLLSYYDIHKPLVSYYAQNEEARGQELLSRIRNGEDVALITDAGTPGISDPGSLLVRNALLADLPVVVIPGATALIAALIGSGLSTHPFTFLGFPPARGSGRSRFFTDYAKLTMTLILYESPQRLQRTLGEILEHWGDRRIAVARELTKLYEETIRGTVQEVMKHFNEDVRGELTLVIEGASEESAEKPELEWRDALKKLLEKEETGVKEAADLIARQYGLSRRLVYREALSVKNGPE